MNETKDSGIKWIGEIPAHWKISKVGYHFEILLGKMLQPMQINTKDTLENYLCAVNLGKNKFSLELVKQMWFSEKEKKIYSVKRGDLLVVEGGDIGSADIVNFDVENLYFQNALMRVRPLVNYSVNFLKYWVQFAKNTGHIDLICNKATIAHFTKEKFMKLHFASPPLDEQKAIANFLDDKCGKIDGIISECKKQLEILKDYKKSLITETVTKGLNPAAEMKDSGIKWIGEIPAHWKISRLKYLGIAQNGLTYEPNDISDFGRIVLRSSNIQNGKLNLSDSIFVSCKIPSNIVLQKNDLLICSRNGSRDLIGKCALITDEMIGETYGAFMCNFRSESNIFLYWVFQAGIFDYYLATFLTSTVNQLTNSNLYSMKIPVPPLDEQKAIANFLDDKCKKIDELIEQKQNQVKIMNEYKKSVIYEYVTGKKRVESED